MKDRQPDLVSQPDLIPVIGQLLHWLAMPAAVCLRSSFGYLFLRPRSLFLMFSLAFTLLFIVAWNEPAGWANYAGICSFALAVSWLYIFHLIAAVSKQVKETAEHDLYSGVSHSLRIARALGIPYSRNLEIYIKLWLEPAVFFNAAIIYRLLTGEGVFYYWLLLISVSLWANEFRVYWYHLRKKKRREDLRVDTEEEADEQQDKPDVAAPKPTIKPKKKRDRIAE